jgi:hypothetical protein
MSSAYSNTLQRERLYPKNPTLQAQAIPLQRKKLLTPPFNVSLQPKRGIIHIELEDRQIPGVTLMIQRTRYRAGGL